MLLNNDPSYRVHKAATLVAILLFISACGNKSETPMNIASESWPETAASAASTLRDTGYECLEEGRELYPALYTCSLESETSRDGIFLYANDRNALVGVRVFYSERSSEIFRDALVLALGTQTQVELPVPGDPSETSVTIGDFVVETGSSEGIRFLRITPLKEIH